MDLQVPLIELTLEVYLGEEAGGSLRQTNEDHGFRARAHSLRPIEENSGRSRRIFLWHGRSHYARVS